jgi:hypothetical protein
MVPTFINSIQQAKTQARELFEYIEASKILLIGRSMIDILWCVVGVATTSS